MARGTSQSPLFARRRLVLLVAAVFTGGASVPGHEAVPPPGAATLGLPITFERNDGQFAPGVIYRTRGTQGDLSIRAGEIAITPRRANGASGEVRLRFVDANPVPEIETAKPLATRSHYYIGDKPASYVEGAPHFGELRLKDVYPDIDVALHGQDGAL